MTLQDLDFIHKNANSSGRVPILLLLVVVVVLFVVLVVSVSPKTLTSCWQIYDNIDVCIHIFKREDEGHKKRTKI